MENIPFADTARPGQFPHRFTQDDRFQYRLKVQPVAGQLEFSIRPVDTRLSALAAERVWQGFPASRNFVAPHTDSEDNLRRARLRAKGKVKLLAMEMRVDRLFTFTIRHTGKLMPYEDVLTAWDFFRRMARRADKHFHYVATPERQGNGQWHIHAGVSGFQNVGNFTRMWQSALNRVLGRSQHLVHGPDSPGLCKLPSKTRPRRDQNGRAKAIAKYIGKYIGKSLEAGFNRKKYFHTPGIEITPAQRQWLAADGRNAAVLEALGLYGLLGPEGFPVVEIKFWNRDAHSAWFTVSADSVPPPF